MPTESKILNITRHKYNPGEFVMFVEHPSFPAVSEGAALMEIAPTYSRIDFNFNVPEIKEGKKIKMYRNCVVDE